MDKQIADRQEHSDLIIEILYGSRTGASNRRVQKEAKMAGLNLSSYDLNLLLRDLQSKNIASFDAVTLKWMFQGDRNSFKSGLLRKKRFSFGRSILGIPIKNQNQKPNGTIVSTAKTISESAGHNKKQAIVGGRWTDFRRLCHYYMDCLRLGESPNVRLFPDNFNATWISLGKGVPWDRIHKSDCSFTRILVGKESDIQLNRTRQGRNNQMLVGYLLEVVFGGNGSYALPIYLVPMKPSWEAGRIHLVNDGPIMVNGAWLDFKRRFKNRDEQCAFCELVGLMPQETEDVAEVYNYQDVDIMQLAARTKAYFGVACVEELDPNLLEDRDELREYSKEGIYNEAVLAPGASLIYAKGLVKDLNDIADRVEDSSLDNTVLSHVFPYEKGSLEADGEEVKKSPLPGVLQLKVLNPEQFKAVEESLSKPVTTITGPPGTGKSEVVRSIMMSAAVSGKSVLLASKNHRALDAVEIPLNAMVKTGGLVIRPSKKDSGMTRTWIDVLKDVLSKVNFGDSGTYGDKKDLLNLSLEDQSRLKEQLQEWSEERLKIDILSERYNSLRSKLPFHLRDLGIQVELPEPKKIQKIRSKFCLMLRDRIGIQGFVLWIKESIRTPWKVWEYFKYTFCLSREKEKLIGFIKRWPCPFNEGCYPKSVDEKSADEWDKAFDVWESLYAYYEIKNSLDAIRGKLQELLERDQTLEDLSKATQRSKDLNKELMEIIANGIPSVLAKEEQQRLYNLVSGMSNFGNTRWKKLFNESFDIVLKAFPLWAITNLSANRNLPLVPGAFDILIIDEASQCDIASIVPLLFRAKQLVVVGDPQQLGHVTQLSKMRERSSLEARNITSLDLQRFTYRENTCFDMGAGSLGAEPHFLNKHFRCHPDIADYSNILFYQERLDVITATEQLNIPRNRKAGCHWNDVNATIKKSFNGTYSQDEIEVVLKSLKVLEEQNFEGTIGIITPFRMQCNRLKDAVAQNISREFANKVCLLVDTVHGFQGDERDVIILSLCCGSEMGDGAKRFITNNQRLFNVAVTRARAVLEVIGNQGWSLGSGIPHLVKLACNCIPGFKPKCEGNPVFESPWEVNLYNALLEAGIECEPQYSIAGRRLDLAYFTKTLKIDIEVDGEKYHRLPSGNRKDDDIWRDIQLKGLGWRVCRFWVYELRENMQACVDKVLKIIKDHSDGK